MRPTVSTARLTGESLFNERCVRADEFYIVRDLTTQKCTVVNKQPTTDTRTITLATDTIYKSQADAESGMKTIKLCAGNRAK